MQSHVKCMCNVQLGVETLNDETICLPSVLHDHPLTPAVKGCVPWSFATILVCKMGNLYTLVQCDTK